MFKRELASIQSAQDDPWEAIKLMREIRYDPVEMAGDDQELTVAEIQQANEQIKDYINAAEYCF